MPVKLRAVLFLPSYRWFVVLFIFYYMSGWLMTLLGVLWFFGHRYQRAYYESIFWTWDNGADGVEAERERIDTDDIYFPPDFLFGVTTSAHQIEGGARNSNWSRWEDPDVVPPALAAPEKTASSSPSSSSSSSPSAEGGRARSSSWKAQPRRRPPISNGHRSGKACDHWNRVHQDVGLMLELGVNAYRFSLDWAKLQPTMGAPLDKEALEHYRMEVDALLEAGITPMITLHHFTHPLWFEDMGSFEKEENIEHFVTYCRLIFEEFSPKVKLWITVHEPFFFVFCGWINGNFPPGKQQPQLAGTVLKNVLEAHVQVYTALKAMPHGPSSQIGFAKDYYHFDCWAPCNPLDQIAVAGLEVLFNGGIMDFLRTGEFVYRYVGTLPVRWVNKKAPHSYDFIGINYYSHSLVRFRFHTTNPVEIMHLPGAIMTDAANAPIYPEGLYRAIKKVECLKVPIYITENGCADATDDRRQIYLRRHLYALSKALKEGANVRGYFYWTLMDSFEWQDGFTKKFGLYHVDHSTQQRTLRDGARYYQRIIERFVPRPRALSLGSDYEMVERKQPQQQGQGQHVHGSTSPGLRASPLASPTGYSLLSLQAHAQGAWGGAGKERKSGEDSPLLQGSGGGGNTTLARVLAGKSAVSAASMPRSRSGTKISTLLHNMDLAKSAAAAGAGAGAGVSSQPPALSLPSTPTASQGAH